VALTYSTQLAEPDVAALRRSPCVRVLHESPEIVVGEFHCDPDDARWSAENCAEEGHFVVFPGTSVVIEHTGREPVVTGPNHLMLYNRDQTYRRRLLDPSGDHCVFLLVAPGLLAEAALVPEPDGFRFSASHAPASAAAYLLHRLVVRQLESDGVSDSLELEEALYRLVSDAVRVDRSMNGGRRRPVRERTRAEHVHLAEDTKALLSRRVAENLSLKEIAAELHSCPFHLARVFRAQTGFAVHEYRNQLRLRLSLDRIFEPGRNLVEIALELGFASHSHFTDSFRRAFKAAPSRLRKMPTIAEAQRSAWA
jgi:AraC family transcriptional regulator